MNLSHIESRASPHGPNRVEIFAECSCSQTQFDELLQLLRGHGGVLNCSTSAEAGEPPSSY